MLVIFLMLALSGCNGSSGRNDLPTDQLVPTSLTLATYNSNGIAQQSFTKDETITIKATLLDQNNEPLVGKKVDFSATIGDLSISALLTNGQGQVSTTLTNETLLLGAGTISATIASLSKDLDYEFTENSSIQVLPSINSKILLDGVSVNQFRTDQPVQVSVKLVDANNNGIVGEIIQFNAEIGVLSAPSALTNAQGSASVTLSGEGAVGAGVLTATYAKSNVSTQMNYEVLAADAIVIEANIKIGSFDQNNQFNQGVIALSVADAVISAGGTLGLTVDLVDANGARVQTPTPITFTSNCVASNAASIDGTVFTVNGSAKATFEDVNCAGITGTDDVLLASVTINGITEVASTTISIQGEQLGSIEFISAQPNSIVLKGTGGQGKQETSILTFQVKSELGNSIAQQPVAFSLDTQVGGITLNPLNGLTNSQGLITTRVSAGTVPTVVRVTAKASLGQNGQTVQTQSDLLSINTGLPEQRSFTIAASIINPEADGFNGEKSTITTWLADNFNNPVPDGTTVNFTSEGGVIEPSCLTVNGSCSVTWTSAEPRVSDHRVTILATALGHESFFDTNGNNSFDDQDGIAIEDPKVSAGFGRITPQSSGFVDMSEAWRDDNENTQHDTGELFLDFDNGEDFSPADGLFNGPQCNANCAADGAKSINVRKALVLIMAGSAADWTLTDSNSGVLLADVNGNGTGIADLIDGGSQSITLAFSDQANQTLPLGTQIAVSLSAGELAGQTSFIVSNNGAAGKQQMRFVLFNPVGGNIEVATLAITFTTPKGIETSIIETFTLK